MSDDLSSSSSSLGAAAPTLQAARLLERLLYHDNGTCDCGSLLDCDQGRLADIRAALEEAVLAERAACAALVEQWGECASDADRKRAAAIDQGDAVDANAQYARGAAFRACAAALDARNQR
jgi:hypothetical protein